MPTWRCSTGRLRASLPANRTRPPSANSSPARTRSSVVLPEPDGPSKPRNSRSSISRFTLSRTSVGPNRFLRPSTWIFTARLLVDSRNRSCPETPLQHGLDAEGDERHEGQERGDCERGRKGVIVVKNLDVQRHCVGEANDVAGDHRHGSKFPDRT